MVFRKSLNLIKLSTIGCKVEEQESDTIDNLCSTKVSTPRKHTDNMELRTAGEQHTHNREAGPATATGSRTPTNSRFSCRRSTVCTLVQRARVLLAAPHAPPAHTFRYSCTSPPTTPTMGDKLAELGGDTFNCCADTDSALLVLRDGPPF